MGRLCRRVALGAVVFAVWLDVGPRALATPPPALDRSNLPPNWTWPPSPSMHARGEACLRTLRAAGVAFERKAPVGLVATPVVVPDGRFGGIDVRPYVRERSQVMDCHMALSLVALSPVLREANVRALLVSRYQQPRRARLAGRSLNMLSRHALGLALDIRGVVGARGRTHWVTRDARGPLLRKVARVLGQDGRLRAVLTPYNDLRHRDHFHISALMTVDAATPDLAIDARSLHVLAARRDHPPARARRVVSRR